MRSALSDVQLYEDYPSHYLADGRRRHRWIRGDWQILRWLFPRVPSPNTLFRKNPLSALSRWKIFDNLRRSLVPAALTLLLLLGWTALSPPWLWTLAAIGTVLIPSWMVSLLELFQKPGDVLLRQHLAAAVGSAGRQSAQAAFTLACLPYEALFSLDAILRTVWRLMMKKRLLEWNPSGNAGRARRGRIWPPPVGRCGSPPSLPLQRSCIWPFEAGRTVRGRAHTGPLVCLPLYRLVDQPAARSPGSEAYLRPDRFNERAERRARLQARDDWKAFLAKIQPLIHTQQNRILIPTAFSPLR